MNVSRRILFAVLGFPALGILLCLQELPKLGDGTSRVAFLDVGQGDAALVTTPSGKRIVIDGGRDERLLRELGRRLPLLDRTIDLLVLSHPQLDHMAAFPEILRRYDVERVLLTGVETDLPAYREFLALMKEKRVPFWIADPNRDVDFGDGVVIDVVWPPPTLVGARAKNLNDTSIVLRVLLETGAVLFTGDMERAGEEAALAAGADVSATILKVGHHGSKTSSSTGFLLAVGARAAVISAGRKNSYGHPHASVVERLVGLGYSVRSTAEEGTVEMSF